jgi:hypothetical protein
MRGIDITRIGGKFPHAGKTIMHLSDGSGPLRLSIQTRSLFLVLNVPFKHTGLQALPRSKTVSTLLIR